MAARIAQPAPQKAAAVAAAAMQRHHQRPGAVGRVIFRHVEREAAAAAGLVVVVMNAGVVWCRLRQPRQQAGVVAQWPDRERSRRPAAGSRPADTAPPARAGRGAARETPRSGRHCRSAPRAIPRTPPAPQRWRSPAARANARIRSGQSESRSRTACNASSGEPAASITRPKSGGLRWRAMKESASSDCSNGGSTATMSSTTASLIARVLALQCSRGAFSSLARSVEVSTTSKVTPSW